MRLLPAGGGCETKTSSAPMEKAKGWMPAELEQKSERVILNPLFFQNRPRLCYSFWPCTYSTQLLSPLHL